MAIRKKSLTVAILSILLRDFAMKFHGQIKRNIRHGVFIIPQSSGIARLRAIFSSQIEGPYLKKKKYRQP